MKPRYFVAAGIVLVLLVIGSRVGLWVVAAVVVPPILLLNHLVSRDLRSKIQGRSSELGELTFDALKAMEGADTDHTRSVPVGPAFMGPCVASIEVRLESRAPDTLRVLVRGEADLLGATLVRFSGFYKSRDGAVSPVPNHEFDAIPDHGFGGLD